MISHKYRCIFIHIPRTGGSSIERWIHGEDWWSESPETKHLLASQAKHVYREHWDDYFKFAFVRNPWDRMVSCLHYAEHFGLMAEKTGARRGWVQQAAIDFSEYKNLFGDPVTVEHDHRFYQRTELISEAHRPHCVYGNILDEPIDFVGRFEHLSEDTMALRKILGIEKRFGIHKQKSKRRDFKHYYDDRACEEVRRLFAEDIDAFDYEFDAVLPRAVG